MNSLFCTIILALQVWVCTAQAIKPYSLLTNKAELAVVDSQYGLALQYYDTAFSLLPYAFAKDHYNAAIVAALCENYVRVYTELTHVIASGLELNDIQESQHFKPFLDSKQGKKFILQTSKIKPSYNPKHREFAQKIITVDQEFRIKEGGYDRYGDTIRAIDSMNVLAVNKFIAQNGFPSEQLIGTNWGFSHILDAFFRHQQVGSPNRMYNYTDLLTQAYDDDKLDVHTAAILIEVSSGNSKWMELGAGLISVELDTSGSKEDHYNGTSPLDRNELAYFALEPEEEKRIDALRLDFGLESLGDFRKKQAFNFKHNNLLVIQNSMVSFFYTNEKEYYDMLKNMTVLK